MKKKYFLVGILFLAGAGLLLSACGKKEPEATEEVIRPVKVLTIGQSEIGRVREYPGTTEATDTAKLAFQHPGKVIKIPIKRGQEVKKGDLLAKIDPRDFEQDVAETSAALAETKADLERYRRLYEEDAVPLADLQVKEKDFEAALADLNVAKKALEDTELRAPYDGVVSKKLINNFQNVNTGDVAIRVQNISKIEISIYVPESDAALAPKEGQGVRAEATFDAIPDRKFKVDLKEWETEADEATQTFRVKFIMPQPKDVNILPGMNANVSLDFGNGSKTKSAAQFRIPSAAVFPDEAGKSHVWIVSQETMTVHKRAVTVGQITGMNQIDVLAGLNPGDQIAISGIRHLRESMKVRAME